MADIVVYGASRLEQLPSRILKLIFFKLDFKSTCNCKLLTKDISNLISTLIREPSFIQSLVENSPVAFIIQTEDKSGSTNFRVCLNDFEEDKSPDPVRAGCHALTTVKVNANFPVFNGGGKSHILGSCNGLLLMKNVADGFEDCFYICNPLLGEFVIVPSCTRENILIIDEVFGLFFDPMTNHFSVLRILKFFNMNPEAEIHVVGTATWTSIIGNDLTYPESKRIDDVRLNGALHWVAFEDQNKLSICSFHTADKNFKNISLPWILRHDQRRGTKLGLGIFSDCLCLSENIDIYADDDAPHMHVWVMRKYGDVDTWIKVFSMSKVLIPNRYPFAFMSPRLQPISTLKNGEMLMLCWGNRVVCFNPITNKLRGINFEEDVISAYPWIPSFISLR